MLQNRADCDFIVDMNHGADCYATLQNGVCYNPNTMKSQCDYAVNSYFQKKGLASGSFCIKFKYIKMAKRNYKDPRYATSCEDYFLNFQVIYRITISCVIWLLNLERIGRLAWQ